MEVETCIFDLSQEDESADAGKSSAGANCRKRLRFKIGSSPQALSDAEHALVHDGYVELLAIDTPRGKFCCRGQATASVKGFEDDLHLATMAREVTPVVAERQSGDN